MLKYQQTRATLKNQGLAPKKRFGQNFLIHKSTAENIVRCARLNKRDSVIEVGVGLGALTLPLARAVHHVYGYEIDSGIIRMHREKGELPENVTLVHNDILKTDLKELHSRVGDLVILANLPYSISNPFIFKLIENHTLISTATVMLQKEVADRLVAHPGTKEYGIPTILLGACASVEKLMTLKPTEFHPRPKIDSVVVKIDFNSPAVFFPGGFKDKNSVPPVFRRVVRVAFSQRRKTVLNTLSGGGFFLKQLNGDGRKNKELTKQAIEEAGLAPSIRPERITIEEFMRISAVITKRISGGNISA
ncbi:16S rRNA (adenine(1518)-N(6)/adenine(1519)-N(6))-dimethyltransferase RsmA [Desulfomarina sp.]